ncbi:hypothetical protein A0J61_07210 [Choanephora cucurbitarum]|uniref:Uncharacterized protein n=1 Tax=Choanephora cucurbitarum TaxID=101091 RepID=A0A1C7N6L2_9FUNG|nr:hypothetical protein A0J61_07210 [Choanephora cucurbitarum]
MFEAKRIKREKGKTRRRYKKTVGWIDDGILMDPSIHLLIIIQQSLQNKEHILSTEAIISRHAHQLKIQRLTSKMPHAYAYTSMHVCVEVYAYACGILEVNR